MGKPTLYGISASRAFRSIWAAEEIGLEYNHVATSFRGDAQAESYRSVNPNARIPALVDGDFKLFESMAINLYLAQTYGPHLSLRPQGNVRDRPQGLWRPLGSHRAQALTWQWTVWGISEIEPLQMQIVVQKLFTKPESRNAGIVAGAERALERPLAVLNAGLADQAYLLGDEFTIADLNLSGVMDLFKNIEFETAAWPNVERWLKACYSRPSYQSAKRVGT